MVSQVDVVSMTTACSDPSPHSAGSADTLVRTYFPDGMSESLVAYLLHGVLEALEYLHRMGYVHRLVLTQRSVTSQVIRLTVTCPSCRGVKASHILLSGEGQVYLSGLHSVFSLMREGQRVQEVFDMPQHSPALLPWLSPELLRQVSALLTTQRASR